MADEQHEWLDKEAAEKMLRREPVDPSDGPPRNEAERLAAALDAVARTARPAAGELPGEAAALAAFRAVRRPAARTAATATADPAPAAGTDDSAESGMLAPVHIRPAGSGTASGAAGFRGPRPMRWSRPIRFGLVASLACCAIGGVAVAAGTGMLPGPFSRHTPTPATSVSAAASPEELGSDLTTDDETSAPPPGSPGGESASPDTPRAGGPESGRPDGSDRTPAPNRESDGGDGSGDSRSGGAEDKPSSGTGATPSPGGQDGDGTSGDSGDEASWYAKTLKACRDYRDGKLDEERRSRLEALAKGARNLDRFCERMLDQADGKNGDGAGRGDDGDDEPAGSGGSSGGSGTLPSIGFSTASPEPSTTAESSASGSSRSSSPSLAAR
ncbi:hypothetical protein OG778_21170 [Streptomyces sp. NBC_00184]|uniref:hypothetical protein n=1 Tax=Streptomyces sp. NBC_00184 TaxID=2975673 RepID=UPI002E29B34F|nr:hypothetical protein [Streptomyces sp. NBC_00184]